MFGVNVVIVTSDSWDTIYRASVDFTLTLMADIYVASDSIFVQIDGEDGSEFIVGLADNIGLESSRADRIVVAAVAPTHSWLLQAWHDDDHAYVTATYMISSNITMIGGSQTAACYVFNMCVTVEA
ncbi:hypothetical protein QVD17_24184 [Tagetes erecta]|uniref:Uncharacterized protein n=1 Tax=Tagetes erecta TaxID=13708 RepID=A0AAD8KEW5_TARER|nr:hypothetical protein QVD17_24184 [Tagetes erecta]